MRFLVPFFLFAIAVGGFALLAKTLYQGSVEAELEELAAATLAEENLAGVRVTFDHHDAILSGHVDSEEDRGRVVEVLSAALPMARIDPEATSGLSIRPTLPPTFRMVRSPGAREVLLEGILGADDELSRRMFESRLAEPEGVDRVQNELVLDPRQLPLDEAAELASIAVELLRESDEAELSLDSGVLTVVGKVSNPGRRDAIMELVRKIDAESVDARIEVLPPEESGPRSEILVTRNRFGVILSGLVGTAEFRDVLLGVAESAAAGGRVTDRISVEPGVESSPWEQRIEEFIPGLLDSFVGEMTAEFGPDQIRLNGETKDEEAHEALLARLETLKDAAGVSEVVADVRVRTYVGPVSESGAESRLLAVFQPNLLSLTGILPDIAFVGDLESSLKEISDEYLIENELVETDSTAGAGWTELLPGFLLEAASRLENGKILFEDNRLVMEGRTRELTDGRILQNVAINTVPTDFSIENRLSHEEPPKPPPPFTDEDRAALEEGLAELPIYFEKNSDTVSSNEQAKLESIYELISGIEVPLEFVATGFADNVGNAEYNRQLSLRRAEAVIAGLAALGADRDSIEKVSEGEDVSNVSRSERWKARRVEVSLAGSESDERESNQENR